MNSYDAIRDRYEDALVERLMEAVRTAQGRMALAENERLRADSAAAVPETLDEQCRQIIKQGYRKGRLHRAGRRTLRIVTRVAIIAAVLMLTFAMAFAASPAIRTATTKWIVTMFGDQMEIVTPPKADPEPNQPDERRRAFEDLTIHAGWLPDQFEEYTSGKNENKKWVIYKEPSGCTIEVEVHYGVGKETAIHMPHNDVIETEIGGVPALLLSTGERDYCIVWTLEEYGADVFVLGSGMSETEMMLFAQNLLLK